MLQSEASKSFAVGHFALGYVFGKASSKLSKTEIDLPLIFMLSVIPDIDILIPFLQHRGPTHSIFSAIVLFIPAFVVWRRKALPYFAAFLQHSLVGDYLGGGGLQLLWPLTNAHYGFRIDIKGATNVVIELFAFLVAMLIMLKTKDMSKLFEAHVSNLILVVPVVTVVLPTLLAYPFYVPLVLLIPHVIYLAIFLISILAYVRRPKAKLQPIGKATTT